LHIKNQLPRLLITALIVISPGVVVWCGVVWWFILTDNNTTPTKVVLGCWLGCGNKSSLFKPEFAKIFLMGGYGGC
jgi:hypothetical protein